jgi:putative restriction endonuclease
LSAAVVGLGLADEQALRSAAFLFLDSLAAGGRSLVRQSDVADFSFQGNRLRLMATQSGIWKPAILQAALSFNTVFASDPSRRPYDDEVGPDGYLRYKWRYKDPTDPSNYDLSDNRAMRSAMRLGLPLIWFQGVERGLYLPIYPVYLAAEEATRQQFVVAVDEGSLELRRDVTSDPALVRSYALRTVKERLHQPLFRQRVLVAYENRCSLCHLRHVELLDAAHVLADSEGGEPVVTNGIAMCKIHHAAYDADIFGIAPNYRVGVRRDVMDEVDGPTLRYALQGINGQVIGLPRRRASRPDPDLLEQRWTRFQEVS